MNGLSERSEPKDCAQPAGITGALLAHGKPSRKAVAYCLYLLRLGDGRLSVGHSNDPPRRQSEHARGKGCRATRIFGAGEVPYTEEYPARVRATRHERQVKG